MERPDPNICLVIQKALHKVISLTLCNVPLAFLEGVFDFLLCVDCLEVVVKSLRDVGPSSWGVSGNKLPCSVSCPRGGGLTFDNALSLGPHLRQVCLKWTLSTFQHM
jgi:hypothetical protein